MAASRLLLVLSALLLIAAGAAAQASERTRPWTSWTATLARDHPLAGKIWSTRAQRMIEPEELAAALTRADLVLLGEVHDNPDHHRLQAWMIGRIAGSGSKPAVAMEMIARDKAERLATYLARPDASAAGLGEALDWDKSGWPDWSIYRPVAEAAFENRLAILPADPERSLLRRVGKEGLGALGKTEAARLQLSTPLGEALTADLLDALYLGHCKLIAKDEMGRMLHVQRLRDAVQTDQLLKGASSHNGRAILIAGNGHVRADRGVPWYLGRRAPDKATVTVLLLEVDAEAKTVQELIPPSATDAPVADYLWFTPRQAREDPCEALRRRFGASP